MSILHLMWDYRQHLKIEANDLAQATTSTQVSHLKNRNIRQMEQLQTEIDQLSLVCQAMWTLIQDNLDISESELKERIVALDMLDGVLDGKMGAVKMKCPECDATMNNKIKHCMFCGYQPESGGSPFTGA